MLTLIFDSHAHYDDPAFDADRDAVLGGLAAKGVGRVLNCGAAPDSSRASLALAHRWPFIKAAVGIHPEYANDFDPAALAEIETLCADPACVAIGEIGLDYHYEGFDRARQAALFSAQLALAARRKLPVVIHCRDALADTLSQLAAYDGPGVFHCFSGAPETAKLLLERGFYLGFGGVVTFKNARRAVDSVAACPLDRLLLETDCPYMAPEPHRGQRNDSTLLGLVAARIAAVKNTDPETVIRAAADNACRLFGCNKEE